LFYVFLALLVLVPLGALAIRNYVRKTRIKVIIRSLVEDRVQYQKPQYAKVVCIGFLDAAREDHSKIKLLPNDIGAIVIQSIKRGGNYDLALILKGQPAHIAEVRGWLDRYLAEPKQAELR
jgi:hypothetical protein